MYGDLGGLYLDTLRWFLSAPAVQGAAFGAILVMVVARAPIRWLRRLR